MGFCDLYRDHKPKAFVFLRRRIHSGCRGAVWVIWSGGVEEWNVINFA